MSNGYTYEIQVGVDKALKGIESVSKQLSSLGDAFSALQKSIPKDFGHNFKEVNEEVKPLSKTLRDVGNAFKSINNNAIGAVNALLVITKTANNSPNSSSFSKALEGLNSSIAAVDTHNIDRVSKSLNTLGRALTSISSNTEGGLLGLNKLSSGVNTGTKVGTLRFFFDDLISSFSSLDSVNLTTTGLGKSIGVLTKVKSFLSIFNDTSKKIGTELDRASTTDSISNSLHYFVKKISEINMRLSTIKTTDSAGTNTIVLAIDGVLRTMQAIITKSKNLTSYVANNREYFDYFANSELVEMLQGFAASIERISMTLNNKKTKFSIIGASGSTTELAVDGILLMMKTIINRTQELTSYVANNREYFDYFANSELVEMLQGFVDSIKRISLTFMSRKTKFSVTGSSGSVTELAIDGILSMMKAIINKTQELTSYVANNREYFDYFANSELVEMLKGFVASIESIRMALFQTKTNIKTSYGETSSVTLSIDGILNLMSTIGNRVEKLTAIAHRVTKSFNRFVTGKLLNSIRTFVKQLNEIRIVENQVVTLKDGSSKSITTIEKVISFLNRLANLAHKLNTKDFTSPNGLHTLTIALTKAINNIGNLTLKPAYAGFEKLANAMYKFSIGVKAVITNTDKATRAIKRQQKATEDCVKATNWLVGGWRSVVTAFAGGSIIYTIVRSIQDASASFLEFNKNIHLVNTMARLNITELRNMQESVLGVSIQTGISAKDMSNAMFAIVSATIMGADALKVLHSASMLAVAGATDVVGSAQLLSRVLMAYGKPASEVTHITDILFKTQERGITTIAELNTELGKVLGTAVSAKVSFDQLGAAVATLTARGLKTNLATTALNSVIMKLAAGTAELDKVFQKLGHQSAATALEQKGLYYVMRQIQLATGGSNTELQKLGFNYRDIRAATILANDQAGIYAKNLSEITDKSKTAGKTLQAFEEVNKSLAQKLAVTASTLKAAVISLTEFIAKFSGINKLLGIFNKFSTVPADFNTLTGALKTLLAPLTSATIGISLFTTASLALIGAAVSIKTKLGLAFADILSGKLSKNLGIFGVGLNSVVKLFRSYAISAGVASNATLTFSASVKVLRVALMSLGRYLLVLAGITLALKGVAALYEAIIGRIESIRADRYIERTSLAVEALLANIDKLSSVTAIDLRLDALKKELEALESMKQTSKVTKRIQALTKAIEVLNNKKISLDSTVTGGEALDKYVEALKAYHEGYKGTIQSKVDLEYRLEMLRTELRLLKENSSAWYDVKRAIVEANKALRDQKDQLRDVNKPLKDFLMGRQAEMLGGGEAVKLDLDIKDTKAKLKDAFTSFAGYFADLPKDFVNAPQEWEYAEYIKNPQKALSKFNTNMEDFLRPYAKEYQPKDAMKEFSESIVNLGAPVLTNLLPDLLAKQGKPLGNLLASYNTTQSKLVSDYAIESDESRKNLIALTMQENKYRVLKDLNEMIKESGIKINENQQRFLDLNQAALSGVIDTKENYNELNSALAFASTQVNKIVSQGYGNLSLKNTGYTIVSGLREFEPELKRFGLVVDDLLTMPAKDAKRVVDKVTNLWITGFKKIPASISTSGITSDIVSKFGTKLMPEGAKSVEEELRNLRLLQLKAKALESKQNVSSFLGMRSLLGIYGGAGSSALYDLDTFRRTPRTLEQQLGGMPFNYEVLYNLTNIVKRSNGDLNKLGEALKEAYNSVKDNPALLQQLVDGWSKYNEAAKEIKGYQESLLDIYGTSFEKLAYYKKEADTIRNQFKRATGAEKARLGMQLAEILQKQLNTIPQVQAVGVSEQVTTGSREAYAMIQKQATMSYYEKMNKGVGDINSELRGISRELSRILPVPEGV